MINKWKSLRKKATPFDLTPKGKNVVTSHLSDIVAPSGLATRIERSGVNVEVYIDGDTKVKAGAFCLWSPKNGGTLHIDGKAFSDGTLLWYDKQVLIKVSLSIHRDYKKGILKVKNDKIYWKDVDYTEIYRNNLSYIDIDMPALAISEITDLPWLLSSKPEANNQESTVHHIKILSKVYV